MDSNNMTATHASNFHTTGALLQAAKEWTSVVENFPYSLAALIFYYLLFQSELIPQWLSVWGAIAAILLILVNLLEVTGITSGLMILYLPIILNELVLAIWLIVKGFNPSAIVSESAITSISEDQMTTSTN